MFGRMVCGTRNINICTHIHPQFNFGAHSEISAQGVMEYEHVNFNKVYALMPLSENIFFYTNYFALYIFCSNTYETSVWM